MGTWVRRFSTCGLFATMVGCGGGGGNDEPPAPKDTAAISSATAPSIAAAVLTASFGGADAVTFTGFVDGPAPTANPTGSQGTLSYKSATSRVRAAGPTSLASPFDPQVTDCALGGTLTVSGSVANPLTLSTNDTLIFDYDACAETGGEANGRVVIRIIRFSGRPETGAYTVVVRADLVDLAVTAAGETAIAKGSMTLTIDVAEGGGETDTITAILLAIEQSGEVHSLGDYTVTETLDAVTGAWSVAVEGTLTSTAFAGSATFETVEPFVSVVGGFPSMGELVIHGANGATIRAVALDGTFVRLEIDDDGDGVVDASVDATWAELT
jgi:hypothetical protein